MAFIASRIFVVDGTKNLLKLQNEEIVRYIGTDWTSLRIGISCAMTANGVSDITGRLSMGVCSGQTNPCGVGTTTNFAGFRDNVGVNNWTYTANSGDPYYTTGFFYGLNRVGNSNTTYGAGGTTTAIVSTAPGNGSTQRRSLIYVDVNKNSTAQPFFTATAQMANDFSFTDFLAGLEWPSFSAPRIRNLLMTGQTQQSVSLSETPGSFDNVDIAWTGASQALEIYAMGVYRKT